MIGFIFWLLIAYVIYVYAGYPILIGLIALCRRRPDWPSRLAEPPFVTLLIAAYNEENAIGAKIENSMALDYPRDRIQILVAADGSNDRTCEIVSAWADRGVELAFEPQRRGKMAAINRVMQLSRGEIVIFSDANNHYTTNAIHELVAPFADANVGAVTGAKRVIREKRGLSAMADLYWRYESFLKASESRIDSCVAAAGEIFAMRRSLFRAAPPHIINDDFYMLMDMLGRGKRVIYRPEAISYEHASSTAVDEVERWSRIVAGRYQALALAPRLFPWRRPLLVWQVISHKFCRPFVAMALLGAFVCSMLSVLLPVPPGMFNALCLAPPYNMTLFLSQALFWSIGLMGIYVEWPGRIGKIFYLPSFLLNANWASLVGLWRATSNRQTVLWNRVQRKTEAGNEEPRDASTRPITIIHLRTASGGGGGPDKTIFNMARMINPSRFTMCMCYLRRRTRSVAPLMARARQAGLDYIEIPGGMFFDIAQFWLVWRLMKTQHTDILHCHDPKSDIYGMLLRMLCPRVRLISTMHGWLPGHRRSLSNRLDLWSLKRYDCVLAVSNHTNRIALRNGVRNAVVVHNAIDAEEWCPSETTVGAGFPLDNKLGDKRVGYMGRLSKEKGGTEFIRLAARVGASNPQCTFLVAGDGPERDSMEKLAIELGVAEKVKFMGRLESNDLLNYCRSLDVLVSPSWTEGLPNNVLEACATATPVVATDVGGTGEIIRNGINGFLVPAGDIEEMARCVLDLLSDSEMAQRMAQEARRTVEKDFSMRARTQRVEQIYTGLMVSRRRPNQETETRLADS